MRQIRITQLITQRDSKSLDVYLSEVSKVDLVTAADEVELAEQIKAGDEQALERLVTANLRFVVSVAKQYQNQGVPLVDLINEGNVGLIKAARKFDGTKGFKFISYAVWWIRQSIIQCLMDHARIVKLPSNKAEAYSKLKREVKKFQQQFQREPTDTELSEMMGFSKNEVRMLRRGSKDHFSIDAPLGTDDGASYIDVMNDENQKSPDSSLVAESMHDDLVNALKVLNPREREILSSFFGLDGSSPLSLEELGEKFDLTRERVRQIKDKCLRRLRQDRRTRTLVAYLG